MLRQSTQHLMGDLDYVVQRPIRVQWAMDVEDDIRDLNIGDVIPGEIAEAWPGRAINNLIRYGKVVAVPRGTVLSLGEGSSGGGDVAEGAPAETPAALSADIADLDDDQLLTAHVLVTAALEQRGFMPLVGELVAPPAPFEPVKLGGGFFQLSDGSKVRGKNKAVAAQAKLDEAAVAQAETETPLDLASLDTDVLLEELRSRGHALDTETELDDTETETETETADDQPAETPAPAPSEPEAA